MSIGGATRAYALVQYSTAAGSGVVVAGMLPQMPARKCTRVVRSDGVNIRNERR